ncbi:bifunctional phosphoribosyl-AMP cyclohydrolase/phosphoribosyl-ATP diphosphatase HisIE [Bacillus sp. SG-1]|uniref:bifunctional phosphoribosyl-AMP cyclohydrolase/phosphoribosyl-ATP diphosphatase HisIE n=1 Tax=Bacillus sp. SG-1 TaxID=161544 RepID=UPI000154452B|nr:bifunctional phosphoribosyl-AMP cyclohydrolase/phosphoribosyl-ATP diphosphatase HisIE [Bacillus sp. SG-1]EDL64638.1 bifunctional phosphoribosyl-AMP cyclohydrolase/phosphoribosyl-ATP pyrophosphatase protein [Bacillus sp. SG-1]
MSVIIERIQFDEKGLVPAIVQDASTKKVLTLAYMNAESLKLSVEKGETWFYSRSRQELWHKGATSGNTQRIVEMRYDCDQDAVLVEVEPKGPACHKGNESCFEESFYKSEEVSTDGSSILTQLEKVISDRFDQRPEGAYTTYLFEEGVDKILKKIGEEAAEVIIAAKNRDKEELKWESADLLYHMLVLLKEQGLPLNEVFQTLEERHNK